MVYLHKLAVQNSELAQPYFLAAACVFVAAKVRYTPVTLKKAVQAFFELEKRRNPSQMAKAQLS